MRLSTRSAAVAATIFPLLVLAAMAGSQPEQGSGQQSDALSWPLALRFSETRTFDIPGEAPETDFFFFTGTSWEEYTSVFLGGVKGGEPLDIGDVGNTNVLSFSGEQMQGYLAETTGLQDRTIPELTQIASTFPDNASRVQVRPRSTGPAPLTIGMSPWYVQALRDSPDDEIVEQASESLGDLPDIVPLDTETVTAVAEEAAAADGEGSRLMMLSPAQEVAASLGIDVQSLAVASGTTQCEICRISGDFVVVVHVPTMVPLLVKHENPEPGLVALEMKVTDIALDLATKPILPEALR